ncbi:SDR family oxidoreductase [Patescibacteria group bacterium]|nr:SDR family oxidoreductase [Patescibacteria group bacterium]
MSRIVLITGATSGIGRALALKLAEEGHAVIACGRSSDKLAELHELNPLIKTLHLDVTQEAHFPGALLQVQHMTGGRIDTLLVNAAIHIEHEYDWVDRPYDDWPHAEIERQTFEVNLFGAMRTVRTFLPLVQASPAGRILFMNGSLGSFFWHHHPNELYRKMLTIIHPSYSASKAGLNMQMVHIARQQDKLFVASLNPGWIETAVGGHGHGRDKPRQMASCLPHLTKYTVGEIDLSRTGTFIDTQDKKVDF